MTRDYGCTATAPGIDGHEHVCDQPATHPLGREHWCEGCQMWWLTLVAAGITVARPANLPEDEQQEALW